MHAHTEKEQEIEKERGGENELCHFKTLCLGKAGLPVACSRKLRDDWWWVVSRQRNCKRWVGMDPMKHH